MIDPVVVVASVPHTGTRSTMRILELAEVHHHQRHFVGEGNIHWLWNCELPTIVPLRDKDETRASWERRNKALTMQDMEDAWAEMERYIAEKPDTYVLRVDEPDNRVQDLSVISAALGVELEPDFSVKVGVNGG